MDWRCFTLVTNGGMFGLESLKVSLVLPVLSKERTPQVSRGSYALLYKKSAVRVAPASVVWGTAELHALLWKRGDELHVVAVGLLGCSWMPK